MKWRNRSTKIVSNEWTNRQTRANKQMNKQSTFLELYKSLNFEKVRDHLSRMIPMPVYQETAQNWGFTVLKLSKLWFHLLNITKKKGPMLFEKCSRVLMICNLCNLVSVFICFIYIWVRKSSIMTSSGLLKRDYGRKQGS